MSKGVLEFMESIVQQDRKARWTAPVQKPAEKPQAAVIPEDDADLLAYREELLAGGDTEGE